MPDRKSYKCPVCGAVNTVLKPSHMTTRAFKQGLPKTVVCCLDECAGTAVPLELQAVA